MASTRLVRRTLLAAVLVVYVLLMGRAVTYAFVWDDVREIEQNAAFDRPLAEGLLQTQTARTDPSLTELSTIELAYDSYRPLLFASLWLDVQLWGRSPGPLHAVNLLLGAIAILLVYVLARRWLPDPLALIPTAMFALHPVQIEAVAYISGRGDVLAGLFALLASIAAVRAIDSERRGPALAWCALSALAFAASLLSKEANIGVPVVVVAIAWLERRMRSRWWVPATLVAVAVGYLVVRSLVVSSTQGQALRTGVFGMPGIWLEYVRIVVLPFDLSTERMRQRGFAVPGLVIAAVALAAITLVVRRGLLSRNARVAVVGLVWMTTLVAPAAIPILSTRVVADRYFYVAIFGLALALTAGIAHVAAHQRRYLRPFVVVGVMAGMTWLFIAWRQVPVWHDTRTLYQHAASMSPDSSMAQYRVGYLDAEAGNWEQAIARFERAIELDARNLVALNNLGVAYLRTRQPAAAADVLATAVAVNPAHFRAWLNLGLAQWTLGDRVRGCASIARALEINPGYVAARRENKQRCGR